MHTFAKDNVRIHYNSDASGDAVVMVNPGEDRGSSLSVPCQALIDFVASLVRSAKIAELEQATTRELLGVGEMESKTTR